MFLIILVDSLNCIWEKDRRLQLAFKIHVCKSYGFGIILEAFKKKKDKNNNSAISGNIIRKKVVLCCHPSKESLLLCLNFILPCGPSVPVG